MASEKVVAEKKEQADMNDDKSDFSHSSEEDHSLQNDELQDDNLDPNAIAQLETRAFLMSRVVVVGLLIFTAAAAGIAAFFLTSRDQHNDFKRQYEQQALEVIDLSERTLIDISHLFGAHSTTMTTFAAATSREFPKYTHPEFEVISSELLNASHAKLVSWSPIVAEYQRQEWQDFISSPAEISWMSEGLAWEGSSSSPLPTVSQNVFAINQFNQITPVAGPGPYAPIWQTSPVPTDPNVINRDLLADKVLSDAFTLAAETKRSILTSVVDAAEIYGEAAVPSTQAEPHSYLITPIYDSHDASSQLFVGAIISVLPWNAFFSELLFVGASPVDVVVDNGECGDKFTYVIEGPNAKFAGFQDLHESDYDDLDIVSAFGIPVTPGGACKYTLTVYPTRSLENDHKDKAPIFFTLTVVLIFILTAIIFLVYDWTIQRRQAEVMNSAARSNAIVSSLFPAEIRDRLFGNEDDKKKGNLFPGLPESSKFRLKNYLAEEDGGNNNTSTSAAAVPAASGTPLNTIDEETGENNQNDRPTQGPDVYETKPIADLFPNTTVMFADIAGFTAWSSVREPSQVFTLLETVYRAFDGIAKRRRVFKVETVGDCYVAVTGLPEPRKDHAVVMARFARDCLEKFNELAKQLEITLGPDTGDLAMRVGLHSGPVTAGVLRGDKSRFQLFGDTVNTAARVESTGQRNRIHLSQETAELLVTAGKSHWVKKRNETVVAKGKGEMQTFWLHNKDDAETDVEAPAAPPQEKTIHSAPKLGGTSVDQIEKVEESLSPKVKRLVGWNVEILKKLLQQIVAKRNAITNRRNFEAQILKMEAEIGRGFQVLDEVVEIIALPKFDAKAFKNQENPSKIELPAEVVKQLRDYVMIIAAMHRDNPFHNFEHASHVTMSVSKLLSRIVAPDIDDTQGESFASSLHDHTYGITSDPLTQFSVVLSALIHDVDHFGVSNFQLIKEKHKLAAMFKNKSVAEQNSIVLAWEKLMSRHFTELRRFIYSDPSELERFRKLVTNSVLATDIFDKELQTLRKKRWETAFKHRMADQGMSDDDINRKATIVIEHLIQASDVAHTMQHWHIYQKWNERLFSEMTVAYQNGRMEKDPSVGWYQGELGFFDNYIIPLAKKLKDCGVFGVSSDEYLNYALENRREWASKGEEVVASMVAKYHGDKESPQPPLAPAAPESAPQKMAPLTSTGIPQKKRPSIKDNATNTTDSTSSDTS